MFKNLNPTLYNYGKDEQTDITKKKVQRASKMVLQVSVLADKPDPQSSSPRKKASSYNLSFNPT